MTADATAAVTAEAGAGAGGAAAGAATSARRQRLAREAGAGARVAAAGAGEEIDSEAEEPMHAGLSPEARAAALAETGVLEGDGDDAAADEEDGASMEDDEIRQPPTTPTKSKAMTRVKTRGLPAARKLRRVGRRPRVVRPAAKRLEDRVVSWPGAGVGAAAAAGVGAAKIVAPSGRARVRRLLDPKAMSARPAEAPRYSEPGASAEAAVTTEPGAPAGNGNLNANVNVNVNVDDGQAGAGDGQGPRRIMTPVDAALEILRGQAPGRGVHVRQIADGATRRRLVHGEPNEAWRVMRTALAAEPRERLRAGLRPRVRAAGAGCTRWRGVRPTPSWNAPSRCSARRAARCASGPSPRSNGASPSCPAPAFEALARVLLQREGFGPATFVKRVEGTIYVEALRGRGPRSSRCLVGLRSAARRPAGARSASCARAFARAARTRACSCWPAGSADDAIAEWKQPGPPIEIADGPAMAETCIRHGVGVINTMVSVDFVDADFFADIAEG